MSENYTLVGILLAGFAGLYALFKSQLTQDGAARKEEVLRMYDLLLESQKRDGATQQALLESNKEMATTLRILIEKPEKDRTMP